MSETETEVDEWDNTIAPNKSKVKRNGILRQDYKFTIQGSVMETKVGSNSGRI